MSDEKKNYWWMDIEDKVEFEGEDAEGRFCSPHRIPHKPPLFGEKVTTEPCHTHIADWRRFHHNFFCYVLKCQNYKFMREKTEEVLNSESK